jgi:hypothetical protein
MNLFSVHALHCAAAGVTPCVGPVAVATEESKTITFWGERCDEQEDECICCRAWQMFDRSQKCPTLDEVQG